MNKKYFSAFLVIVVIIYWMLHSFLNSEIIIEKEEIIIDSTVTVSFSSVGDIMCHSTQYNYSWVKGDSFDFKPVFRYVKDYLLEKDILFGNLETVLAGKTKRFSGYPFFNSPNQLAEALKYTGFDFLFTANNHANDQGYKGAKRTLEELKKVNIVPFGTNHKEYSSEANNIFVRKGLRFGVLSYTYGTNYYSSSSRPKDYVNYIDTIKIKTDIELLRNRNVDIVIVYFHFGEQYQRRITEYQRKIVNSTIANGGDIILASHPHIIQQFERFSTNDSKLDSGFVTFSLGNFISNQRWRYADGGLIFNFDVSKNIFTDSVYVSEVSYLPIWVFKGKTDFGKEFIILPSDNFQNDSLLNFMTEADIDSMKKSYFDTIDLFTSKSAYPTLDSLEIIN